MNNQDYYDEEKLKGPKYAALYALDISSGKASKGAAWAWARIAAQDAEEAGVKNAIGFLGTASFPNCDALKKAIEEPEETVIVTRHTGFVQWLAQHDITGDVIEHATTNQVRGKHVIGAVPFHLAALAEKVSVISMSNLTADQRGKDLTPAEMDAAGAKLETFVVRKA